MTTIDLSDEQMQLLDQALLDAYYANLRNARLADEKGAYAFAREYEADARRVDELRKDVRAQYDAVYVR